MDEFTYKVELLLKGRYGLELNDLFNDSDIEQAYESGDSPEGLVEQYATKYDLDRIDLG